MLAESQVKLTLNNTEFNVASIELAVDPYGYKYSLTVRTEYGGETRCSSVDMGQQDFTALLQALLSLQKLGKVQSISLPGGGWGDTNK